MVTLINSDNKHFDLDYYEVNDFCKKICLKEENREEFNKFKKDYHYFEPYFDFVLFKLKYLMVNPLHKNNKVLIPKDKVVKITDYYNRDYKSLIDLKFSEYDTFMVRSSDKELSISTPGIINLKCCLIDPCGMKMMSKTFDSHSVTANTVLNQILISSDSINNHYKDSESESYTYLMSYLQFLLISTGFNASYVIGNFDNTTKVQTEFVQDLFINDIKHKFSVVSVESKEDNLLDSYLKFKGGNKNGGENSRYR